MTSTAHHQSSVSEQSCRRKAFLKALQRCFHTIFPGALRTENCPTPHPQQLLGFPTFDDIEPKAVPDNDVRFVNPVLGHIEQ